MKILHDVFEMGEPTSICNFNSSTSVFDLTRNFVNSIFYGSSILSFKVTKSCGNTIEFRCLLNICHHHVDPPPLQVIRCPIAIVINSYGSTKYSTTSNGNSLLVPDDTTSASSGFISRIHESGNVINPSSDSRDSGDSSNSDRNDNNNNWSKNDSISSINCSSLNLLLLLLSQNLSSIMSLSNINISRNNCGNTHPHYLQV
ncbi:hypothetical protein ACTA71_003662 [Dictyostelium dimigraforme]